jgi:rhamnosyl/mannosyltransferase
MSGPLWPKQELVVRMRVLQFFKTYYPDSYGGIEQVIFQLSQAMSAIGVETDVLALSRNPAPPDEDKVALLDLAGGTVFPSHMRAEAFGIFLLEAAMFAKPLISSEIGTGTSFVNVDGETGIIIHPGDPSALRRAMDYIWTHPDEAARLGKNARARYENLFTGQTMAKAYLSLYRSILAKRHVDTRRNLDVWAK